MRCLVLVLLVACDAGKKPVTSPPASSSSGTAANLADATAAPQSAIDAAVVDPAVVDAAIVEATPDAAVDAPADIRITWLVYPPSVPVKNMPEMLQQPV
ncbi:MAG TPA: hypothetical protein VMZ53_28775, partial [Kofleriaceae bacterium]|nr:hypothetical protein [Kofleriaceae bacterium]